MFSSLLKVDGAFSVAKKFFELPHESKKKYSRTSSSGNNGYIEMEQEEYGVDIVTTCICVILI